VRRLLPRLLPELGRPLGSVLRCSREEARVSQHPARNLWEERPDLKVIWQEAAGACFDLAVKIADVDDWEDAWGNQLDHDKIGYEENQIYWAVAIAPPLSNPVWPWAPFNLEAWRDGFEGQLREMVLEDGPGKWRERLQRILDE
jgi:hypothetical protein